MTDAPLEADPGDLVEVGRANDRFEAFIWARQLEEQGIKASSEKKGSWLRSILYLGRVPYAVSVPRRDHGAALGYLKKYRFL